MENENKGKVQRQLSKEAKELVANETRKNIDESMEYIRENFVKIITDHVFAIKDIKKKAILEDKEEMAEYILSKYIPIKKQMELIKNTLLTDEEQTEGNEKFVKNLMESNFEEKTTYYEEALNNYRELEKIFKFIDGAIEDYKKKLEKQIEEKTNNLEKVFEKEISNENGIQTEREISKLKKKIYILEKKFKEGESAKAIKLAIYENERKYSYAYKEILQEMAEYFSTFFTIIEVFS